MVERLYSTNSFHYRQEAAPTVVEVEHMISNESAQEILHVKEAFQANEDTEIIMKVKHIFR